MTESNDKVREYLDKTFENLNDQIGKAFQPWIDAGEKADKLLDAAQGFSTTGVMAGIRATLSELNSWYGKQMDEFAIAHCKKMKITFNARLSDREQGWVMTAVQSEVAAMNSALLEFKDATFAYAEYVKKHSGVTGILKDFIRGFDDPIDGIKGLFGASSVDRESDHVVKSLNKSTTKVDESQEALFYAIDEAVVNRWNIKIDEIINKIEQVKEEGEKMQRGGSIIGTQPNTHQRPLFAIIFVVLLLVAISIGGFALVSQYSGKKTIEISAPASPLIGMINLSKNTRVWKGPSTEFGGRAVLEEDTNAIVLDKSVPGWSKIRTDFGLEGWVKNDTKRK